MAKAKALRMFVEPIITIAKNDPDSVNARRRVYAKLGDRDTIAILFNGLAPLFKDVPGGYTRIMVKGNRRGDGAKLVVMELTKRTISDNDLLGIVEKKETAAKGKKKVKKGKESAKETPVDEKETKTRHSAPEDKKEKKDEHSVEDVKAKTEKKKVAQHGFFKRFRRKSI